MTHTHRPLAVPLLAAGCIAFSAALVAAVSDGQAKPAAPPAVKAALAPPVADPPVREMTPEQEDTWAADAETTVTQACSPCHPIPEIVRTRHTWREWNDVVRRMAAVGATGTDEQWMTVNLYLTRYYGIVSVNSAPAAEIAAVLGLPAKVAAAVVEYRKANGPFTDLASLEKVEGIDKASLEEQVEAIRYDVAK